MAIHVTDIKWSKRQGWSSLRGEMVTGFNFTRRNFVLRNSRLLSLSLSFFFYLLPKKSIPRIGRQIESFVLRSLACWRTNLAKKKKKKIERDMAGTEREKEREKTFHFWKAFEWNALSFSCPFFPALLVIFKWEYDSRNLTRLALNLVPEFHSSSLSHEKRLTSFEEQSISH